MKHAALARPVLCAMCGMPCGFVCAIKSLISKECAACAPSLLMCVGAGVCAHLRRCAHVPAREHGAHAAHSAHIKRDKHLRHFHGAHVAALHTAQPFLKGKEMEREEKRVIGCTAENAALVRDVVKAWPQLHGLVQQLQAAGIFPGLRALEFTLRGSPQFRAQGLEALLASRAAAEEGGAA